MGFFKKRYGEAFSEAGNGMEWNGEIELFYYIIRVLDRELYAHFCGME